MIRLPSCIFNRAEIRSIVVLDTIEQFYKRERTIGLAECLEYLKAGFVPEY